jgi:hypothetical protein
MKDTQIRDPSGPKPMSILQELDEAISKGTPESRLKFKEVARPSACLAEVGIESEARLHKYGPVKGVPFL